MQIGKTSRFVVLTCIDPVKALYKRAIWGKSTHGARVQVWRNCNFHCLD